MGEGRTAGHQPHAGQVLAQLGDHVVQGRLLEVGGGREADDARLLRPHALDHLLHRGPRSHVDGAEAAQVEPVDQHAQAEVVGLFGRAEEGDGHRHRGHAGLALEHLRVEGLDGRAHGADDEVLLPDGGLPVLPAVAHRGQEGLEHGACRGPSIGSPASTAARMARTAPGRSRSRRQRSSSALVVSITDGAPLTIGPPIVGIGEAAWMHAVAESTVWAGAVPRSVRRLVHLGAAGSRRGESNS